MAGVRQLRELAAAERFSGAAPLDARRANRGSSDGNDSRPLSPDKQVRLQQAPPCRQAHLTHEPSQHRPARS